MHVKQSAVHKLNLETKPRKTPKVLQKECQARYGVHSSLYHSTHEYNYQAKKKIHPIKLKEQKGREGYNSTIAT